MCASSNSARSVNRSEVRPFRHQIMSLAIQVLVLLHFTHVKLYCFGALALFFEMSSYQYLHFERDGLCTQLARKHSCLDP